MNVAGPQFFVLYRCFYVFFFSVLFTYVMRHVRCLIAGSCGIGDEFHDTTFLWLGNVPCIYLSKNKVPWRTSTSIFSTRSNQTWTSKSPIRTKRRIFLSSEMCSLVAEHRRGSWRMLVFEIHSIFRKDLMKRLSPAHVSGRHVYGSSCWAFIPRFAAI